MRRTFAVLVMLLAALTTVVSTATADGGASAPHKGSSAQILTCNAGDLCVWPATDGSSNRCS